MKFDPKLLMLIFATSLAALTYTQANDLGTNPGIVAADKKIEEVEKLGELISFPMSDLRWGELPKAGGIKYANVRGDLAGKGPYEAFVNFPAGADNPFHLHSRDLPAVVLKGTFYAIIDGKRINYPAGSYYNLPANLAHYSGCANGENCLLFQYQTDHFDLIAVKSSE